MKPIIPESVKSLDLTALDSWPMSLRCAAALLVGLAGVYSGPFRSEEATKPQLAEGEQKWQQ